MTIIKMENLARVNEGYEFLQVIKDFDNPLQIFREAFQNSCDNLAEKIICKVYTQRSFSGEELIIDVIDNGWGLEREKVHHFFNLADSTKVDENLVKDQKKIGYKGHGSKIFFNSEKVVIASKAIETNDVWAVTCEDPVKQIRETNELKYSGAISLNEVGIQFPEMCKDSGFFLRIINPRYFKTKTTWYKLNHLSLRDYIKWFTIFGSIKPTLENKKEDVQLYLRGLDFGDFRREYGGNNNIEPKLVFDEIGGEKVETLSMGHYFPEECSDVKLLKKIAEDAGAGKSPTDYNTTSGIDFLVLHNSVPKYIELKGSLKCDVNHSFETITKFICYKISNEISNGGKISDIEENIGNFRVCKNDKFRSRISSFNGIPFTGYKIEPETATIESMEIIALDKVITEVLGGEIL